MIKMQDDLKQEPVQESRSVQVDDKKFVRKLMFKISSLVIVHIILQRKLLTDIKSVKLIMFIWKPTLAIFRVSKTYKSASKWT